MQTLKQECFYKNVVQKKISKIYLKSNVFIIKRKEEQFYVTCDTEVFEMKKVILGNYHVTWLRTGSTNTVLNQLHG